jgi:cephalosporin hydroxylase
MREGNYDRFECVETLRDFILNEEIYTATDFGIHDTARYKHLIELGNQVETVSELGVWQGRTMALFMGQNIKKIYGVDLDLSRFNKKLRRIFQEYAEKNNIQWELIESTSTSANAIREVELLHIDSLHTPTHLQAELDLHSKFVSKYITFHDTKLGNPFNGTQFQLWRVIEKFLNDNKDWRLYEHYMLGKCGHATIKRK